MITLNTFISMDRTLVQLIISRDAEGLTVKEVSDILKDYIQSLEGEVNGTKHNSILGEAVVGEDGSNEDPNRSSRAV